MRKQVRPLVCAARPAFVLFLRPVAIVLNHFFLEQTLAGNLQDLVRWRAHKHVLRQSVGWFENDFAGRIAPILSDLNRGRNLTLILDLPVANGLRRAGHRAGDETRYERMDGGFHDRMRQGFLAIAEAEPERCVLIDASGTEDAVAATILDAVDHRLPTA